MLIKRVTQFFESTTAVVNGQLGVWDTSLLSNDEYVIRLEATTKAGVVNVVEHNVGLSGELKLGNFQLSFSDMVVPVAGIPFRSLASTTHCKPIAKGILAMVGGSNFEIQIYESACPKADWRTLVFTRHFGKV